MPPTLIVEVDDFCICIAVHESKLPLLPLVEAHTSVMVYEVLWRDMKARVRAAHEAHAATVGRAW